MIAEVAKRAHEIINCPNGCGPADQKTPLFTRGSRHVADRGQGGGTQSRHGEQLQRRSVDDPGVVVVQSVGGSSPVHIHGVVT